MRQTAARTAGETAALDLALAVLGRDAVALVATIGWLRTVPYPALAALHCEKRLNVLLADALDQVGVRAGNVAGTVPTKVLGKRLELLLHHPMRYPVETRRAMAALAKGDLEPLRWSQGTAGLLTRAVATVGLHLVVRREQTLRDVLESART
ncbi:hypothetical protein OHV05_37265 (plasmid) [Kitasatospora sp. NBC_00070]|uniref:hypothetical protein n=1 Tax=Kitasatospora sp. NBC_00070 TaxID=2975962 RepID=UPI00324F3993